MRVPPASQPRRGGAARGAAPRAAAGLHQSMGSANRALIRPSGLPKRKKSRARAGCPPLHESQVPQRSAESRSAGFNPPAQAFGPRAEQRKNDGARHSLPRQQGQDGVGDRTPKRPVQLAMALGCPPRPAGVADSGGGGGAVEPKDALPGLALKQEFGGRQNAPGRLAARGAAFRPAGGQDGLGPVQVCSRSEAAQRRRRRSSANWA